MATCAPRSPFVLYGEQLPRSANFTFLGCVFEEAWIDWPLHFQRLAQRANARVAELRKIGWNGYGFSLKVCLKLHKAMIRPTMEYAMALCRVQDLDVPTRKHCMALESFASVGKRACVDTIGFFDDVIPTKNGRGLTPTSTSGQKGQTLAYTML